MSKPGELICVTGASGFIGSHIIKILLQKGYRVRGVVRDLKKEEKYQHLKKFPQKEGQLEFVEADLQAGLYGSILQGCDALIHTATPYIYSAPDPQKEIVEPAVKGTVDAIQGCLDSLTVKRVIITSSGGAIFNFPTPSGYTYTPNDWNRTSSLTNNPYFYSKRLAEEAAWDLWNKNKDKIDLVVVNPLYVLGPILNNILNNSINNLKNHMMGEAKLLPGRVGIVDVRDVARAHVIALEQKDAVGKRLICSNEVVPWKNIAIELKKTIS